MQRRGANAPLFSCNYSPDVTLGTNNVKFSLKKFEGV